MSQASLILPMNRKLAQLLTGAVDALRCADAVADRMRRAVGKHEEARALFERWREGKATEDDGARYSCALGAQAADARAAQA